MKIARSFGAETARNLPTPEEFARSQFDGRDEVRESQDRLRKVIREAILKKLSK